MVTESTRRLFADRNFRLYTVASVVSWLSFFAQTLAVSWLTWELTHSPGWLAVMAVLDIAPYFLLGPWGSVLADRLDRHRMLSVAYGFSLLQSLLLAATSMAGVLGIGMLGVLAFAHGTIHAFSVPAAYGLLPRAVGKEQLPAAIAFSSSYRTLAMFAGPALAGVLLAWFPVYVSFLFNVFGYGLYLLMLYMMRLPPAVATPPSGKGSASTSGWRWKRTWTARPSPSARSMARSRRAASAAVSVVSRSSPTSRRPSGASARVRAWVSPCEARQPSWASSTRSPSESGVVSQITRPGPSTRRPAGSPGRGGATRDDDRWSSVSVECEGVARPARRQSGPKPRPGPQPTISGRRPEVTSMASAEAWAAVEAGPWGGRAASAITVTRPEARRA